MTHIIPDHKLVKLVKNFDKTKIKEFMKNGYNMSYETYKKLIYVAIKKSDKNIDEWISHLDEPDYQFKHLKEAVENNYYNVIDYYGKIESLTNHDAEYIYEELSKKFDKKMANIIYKYRPGEIKYVIDIIIKNNAKEMMDWVASKKISFCTGKPL